jgi:hypothetical protein
MRQESMKAIADRNLMRDYLLGQLDEQSELEEKVSDSIINDEQTIDVLDSVEDEIIEEYLEGSLNSVDKNAVENYFLKPPQRKAKLRSAQLLRHYFETKPARYSAADRKNFLRPITPWISHVRSYGAFAALVLVVISTMLYVGGVRRSHARLENQLAQEREYSANLVEEMALLQPPVVALTLVADRSRGPEAPVPQVEIKASTQRIIVEIALESVASGSYDVRLETKNGERRLWSAKLLPIISNNDDARLVFDLPSRTIESGVYSLVVKSPTSSVRYYDFQAKVLK